MSDSPFTRPVIRPDADILARVPGLCLGCLVHEVEVEPSRPDCQDYLDNELAPRLVARMEGEPLAQWPNLGPSRAGCKACGKDPGRYRISSEALYRRLKQGKGLYAINSVVDANNIASLETGFSLGSYTLANLRGDITFRRGLPGETYEGIGKGGLNLENLPLLADALGPFGSPVSDSTRALVDERTRVCLTIIYGFDGAAPWKRRCASAPPPSPASAAAVPCAIPGASRARTSPAAATAPKRRLPAPDDFTLLTGRPPSRAVPAHSRSPHDRSFLLQGL